MNKATKPAAPTSDQPAATEQLRVVIVGHGKSTLVGRLLHDTNMLPKGKLEAIEEIEFRHAERKYVFIDAPSHREIIRNMVTGTSSADAALLLIDANQGTRGQLSRHGHLLQLLGFHQATVMVNKMDLIGYSEARFRKIERECSSHLESIGVTPTCVIPISARNGDNVATASKNLGWQNGSTVLDALAEFTPPESHEDAPLRLPLQAVDKSDDRWVFVGRIKSGRLSVGDELLFSPNNLTAKVADIKVRNTKEPVTQANAGLSVGFTLDEQIFVERGEIASHVENPPIETDVFHVRLYWLSEHALAAGDTVTLKIGPTSVHATIDQIEQVINVDALTDRTADKVVRDEIADVVVRTAHLVAIDPHQTLLRTSCVVFTDKHKTLGGGVVSMGHYPDQRKLVTVRATNVVAEAHRVTTPQRIDRNRHEPGVLWFTGLSGSGKSTLAMTLEQRLFDQGYQVYVLDGDNVRGGLNANLGFSPEDRAENIRRVSEVAALLTDAGVIVITAFISPYLADRERARAVAGDNFHEIYIEADLETCEARDPKGLYKRARNGEIGEFTGISAPYETPSHPNLVINTAINDINTCINQLEAYITKNFQRG